MAYVAGKLAFVVLRPSNLMLLLALLGVGGLWWRRRWGTAVTSAAILGIAAYTALPVGRWLTIPLENRFPPPDGYPGRVDGAVFLGGGIVIDVTEARRQPSFGATMERFAAIPQLLRRYPEARLVFTGGSPSGDDTGPNEATAVGGFLADQGVPDGRVMLDHRAKSTRENAAVSLSMARPLPGETWLLVTSAAHMPRAMGVFRAAGWPEPLAWPVDYRTTGQVELAVEPRMGERLNELDQAAYEWYGLLYYRFLGYTDSIFPRPVTG
jgi:uncharacterized SAM-binding protein YcdF (DUF218 family)